MSQETMSAVPLRAIQHGFNYRRRYKNLDELADNIKANGLTSPVLLRPLDDGNYQLIAGNRRVRAFTIAKGEDAAIPALIRPMTDAEATAAMASENEHREDTTAIEDAELASRMMALAKGDKPEAAKRLGWSPSKLTSRLALMNTTDEVRNAYIDEKLDLGHVEILAAMRREMQNKVLDKLLEAPNLPTVEQLKKMAEAVLRNLEAAIFNKEDCVACEFNTGNQQGLFETTFEGTRCTDQSCFTAKTEKELEIRADALRGDYQVVRIVRPGDNFTLTPLRAEGHKGVGEDQAKACRACGDFGACVSAAPDKLGATFKDMCFNNECHGKKVTEREKAEKQGAADAAQAAKAAKASGGEATGGGDKGQSDNGAAKASPKAAKAPTVADIRNVVKEHREKVWRGVLSRAAMKLEVIQSRALLVALCLYRPSTFATHATKTAIEKQLGIEGLKDFGIASVLETTLTMNQQQLGVALQTIAANVDSTFSLNDVEGVLKTLKVDLADYWKINEVFLDVLTKAELEAVCDELGIATAMGKDFDKSKNGKKSDFIKAILAIDGFDYKGKIPSFMRW